ncbi:conserved Plasmodium protein, unknown function [Plasmodium knowlesi strain H]|uniref:Uncharacterized protein n=3 Tax=Plasmodium knowlesi TaxID=5850 RepID=A0A5E7X2C4_PLAKH|nr:conserved Plasmodium protein, unknown function [Plasmodium knowlesi strain H]OTN67117.1 Uncharacterized protein PKNOH_S07448800 [Plasmodium knowlesi]CAA9988615.1 conserved Plasmodium protein, unknown function [Plasmodium knowlesi strain H]SBO21454.1 conserved Plasmodium protein, unknown function [Plasmodium knowlesi strain H]SBO21889.1 conserved Plasmodium protein, unknown function [Plasmodium knowlesi strain H]VVS78089.1 conserved Plasmodium protein, unknown function [Plasmodium knowlesi s
MGKNNNKNTKNLHQVVNTQLKNKPSLKWRLINKEANFFDKAFEENLLNFQKMSLNEDDYSSKKEDHVEEKIIRKRKKFKKKRKKRKVKGKPRKIFHKPKKGKFTRG